MATRIRVVLLGLPLMMREIVQRVLEAEGDIAVTCHDVMPSSPDDADHDGTMVIVTSAGGSPGTELPVQLMNMPRRCVLVLGSDGRNAVMHESRVFATIYSDVQAADLLAAIRQAGSC